MRVVVSGAAGPMRSIDAAREVLGYRPQYDYCAMVETAWTTTPAGEQPIPARV